MGKKLIVAVKTAPAKKSSGFFKKGNSHSRGIPKNIKFLDVEYI